MALDKEGRPIPVFVPEPEHAGQHDPNEQLRLVGRKVDDALRACAEMAQRVNAMEEDLDRRVNDKVFEFEQRFDSMIGQRLSDLNGEVDSMKRAYTEQIGGLFKQVQEFVAAQNAPPPTTTKGR